MIIINFTYQEAQEILYCIKEIQRSSCNIKEQRDCQKAIDRIVKAIDKIGVVEYHEEGKKEQEKERSESYRIMDLEYSL